MIDNSARRSSDNDHQLIMKLLEHPETQTPLTLDRKGIRYVHDGISYRDNHIEFRLPIAYQQFFGLAVQALANDN